MLFDVVVSGGRKVGGHLAATLCLHHQPPAFLCQQSHTFEKLKICCDVEVQTNLLRLRVLCKSIHGNFVEFHMTKLKLIQVDDNRKCNKNCRRRKLKCFPGCPLDAVACWGLGQGVRPPAGHRLLAAAAHNQHQLRHMQPNTNTKTNTNTNTNDNHHHWWSTRAGSTTPCWASSAGCCCPQPPPSSLMTSAASHATKYTQWRKIKQMQPL